METTLIEAPDTPAEQTPVETADNVETTTDSPTKESGSVSEPKEPEPSPEVTAPSDEEYEIDGEKLTKSQIKEWREKYGRDSKWIEKNEQKAREINLREKELAPLLAIKPILEQRPELYQQLFQPQQQRDVKKELAELYANIPDPNIDPDAARNWSLRRDQLVLEGSALEAESRAMQRAQKESAERANSEVVEYAKEKYESKVGEEGLYAMAKWLGENIQAKNGIYKKSDVDLAYKVVHEEKYLQELKVETAKKTVAPLLKSKQNVGDGVKKQETQPSPNDAEDDEFVSVVRQKFKK